MRKIFIILSMSVLTASVFGQTKESVKCRIWKTESFCIIPDDVNVPKSARYDSASLDGVSCTVLDEMDIVGVWVTFQGKNVEELNLDSQFSSINLIRKKTKKTLHPIAYMNSGEESYSPLYQSNKSTFRYCTYELEPNEKYDLFILFEDAQAGDKLVIEGFLEVVVK